MLLAVMAVMMGSVNAFAEQFTLTPSAVTTINPSDVDVNYYNADATSWRCSQSAISGTAFKGISGASYVGPIVIMQIDLAELDGFTIQKAEFSFDSKCTVSTKNSNLILASMTPEWDPATVTFSNIAANAGATQISAGTGTNVKTSTVNVKEDVLNAVKDNTGKKVAFAIFTYTAREQQVSNIKLTIDAINASASADVALSYMCGDEEVKTGKAVASIGGAVTLSAEEKASFMVGDKKYIYVSDNGADVTVETEGSKVVVNVREASIYNYSVASSQGGVVNSGSTFEGETLSVGYPHYQLIDGTLYAAGVTNKEYRVSMTVNEDNTSATVTYNKNAENIVFYSEAEDIEGLATVTYGNVAVRASKALAAKATEDKVITTLPAGKYVIAAGVFSSAKTPNYIIKIGVGNEIFDAPVTVVNASEVKSGEFSVPAGTAVTLYAEGMGNDNALDYIYIQKTGEFVAVDVTPFVGDHLVDATVTGNNVTAEFKGRTIKVEAGAAAGTVNILLPATEWKGHSMAQTELSGVVVRETENADVYSLNVVGQKINVDDTEFTVTESTVTYELGDPAKLNAVIKATSDKGDIEVVYNTAAPVDVTAFVGEYLVDATVTGSGAKAEFYGQTIKVEAGAAAGTVNITLPAADYNTHSMLETVINGVRLTDMGDGKYGMSGEGFKVTVDDTEFTANMNANDNYFEVVDGEVVSLTTNIPATSDKGNIIVKYQIADPDAVVAVEAVEVSAPVKRIENGQIVIEKNGVLYGIDGIRK